MACAAPPDKGSGDEDDRLPSRCPFGRGRSSGAGRLTESLREMRWKRWSRLPGVVTMVAVACGALIGIVLLTPAPGMLLVDQALSWLHRQYGIVGAVGRVDLDLAPFRVSPTDLRFAAGDQGAAPFLTIGATPRRVGPDAGRRPAIRRGPSHPE